MKDNKGNLRHKQVNLEKVVKCRQVFPPISSPQGSTADLETVGFGVVRM